MTATCTPASASSSKAAAVSASNCVTPSSGASVRSTFSAARRARSTAAAKRSGVGVLVVDAHALGEGDEVRRQVGARAQAVAAQDRGGHARRRRLAVGAHDVDRLEALLRRAQRRHQPAHAVQAEAHAEELEAQQVALGLGEGHSASSSRRRRSSFSRSAATSCSGALATKPSLASLASARAISPRRRSRSAARLRSSSAGSTSVAGADLDQAAVEGHGRRSARRRRRGPGAPSAPRARRRRRGRPGAPASTWPGLTPASSRHERSAVTAAMTAPDARLGVGVAQRVVGPGRPLRGQQVLGAGHVRPQLLGHERDHRVGEQQRLAQDVEHRGREVVVVLAALVELQVPVAQLAVDEVVEPERGLGEVEGGDVRVELRLGLLQAAEDPAVLDRRRPRRGLGRRRRRCRST